MPKYRLLTQEELQSLEKEFVEYLIVNGIMADDWEKMKEEEPEKAEEIVNLFSDVVFEGVMRKMQFLERRSPKHLQIFQCLSDQLVAMGLRAKEGSDADFTDPEYLKQAVQNPPKDLELYQASKPYGSVREEELFALTKEGCVPADGELFKALAILYAKAKGE